MSRDLCTLDQVIALAPGYTEGDEPAIDELLAELITQESIDFLDLTGREFTAKRDQPETRTFELGFYECEERELWIGDATSVTAVVFVDYAGVVWQTLDPSVWVALPRDKEDFEPITSLLFPNAVLPAGAAQMVPGRLAQVTGTYGWPEIPDNIAGALARFVVYGYLADVASTGTQFADAANQGQGIGVSLARAMKIRERYKRKIAG